MMPRRRPWLIVSCLLLSMRLCTSLAAIFAIDSPVVPSFCGRTVRSPSTADSPPDLTKMDAVRGRCTLLSCSKLERPGSRRGLSASKFVEFPPAVEEHLIEHRVCSCCRLFRCTASLLQLLLKKVTRTGLKVMKTGFWVFNSTGSRMENQRYWRYQRLHELEPIAPLL